MTTRMGCTSGAGDCDSIEAIIEAVAYEYDVTVKELKSHKRFHDIAYPRQIAMWFCRRMAHASLSHIGTHLGGRDHTTCMYAEAKIDKERPAETNPYYADIVNRIQQSPAFGGNQIPDGIYPGMHLVWSRFGRTVKVLGLRGALATVSYQNACGQWTVADRVLSEFAPVAASA